MRPIGSDVGLCADSESEAALDLNAAGCKRRKGRRFALALFLAMIVPLFGGLAIVGGWAWYRFGSRTAALAFVRGQSFVLDPQAFELGTVRQHEKRRLTIRACNLSGRPITVYGVQGFCGHQDGCVFPRSLSARCATKIEQCAEHRV